MPLSEKPSPAEQGNRVLNGADLEEIGVIRTDLKAFDLNTGFSGLLGFEQG